MKKPYTQFIPFILMLILFLFSGCDDNSSPINLNNSTDLSDTDLLPHFPDSKEIRKRLTEKKSQLRAKDINQRMRTVIKVPRDFATIQAAVDAAPPNSLIKVASGTYNELVQVVVDDIHIIGKRGAVLQGAFILMSNDSRISGFNIEISHHIHGIHVIDSENVLINNNRVVGNAGAFFGIVLENSGRCAVSRNEATLTNQGGILSLESQNNEILQNETNNQTGGSGITIWTSTGDNIVNNISNNNMDAGIILLQNAINNNIERNEFLDNILCDIIVGPTATGNTFVNNDFVCIDD